MDDMERGLETPPEPDDETKIKALEEYAQGVNDGSLREGIDDATDFDPDLAVQASSQANSAGLAQ